MHKKKKSNLEMEKNKILLSFDNDFFKKIKTRAKQRRFKNIEQFIIDVLRHNVYRKGAISKKKDAENLYLDKFSSPTRETAKIIRSIQPR